MKWFFLAAAVIILYIAWQILAPYAITLITAAVAAVVFSPIDSWVKARVKNRHVSAFFISLGVFLIVVIPLLIAGAFMVQQANQIVEGATGEDGWLQTFSLEDNSLVQRLPSVLREEIVSLNFSDIGKTAASWFAKELPGVLSDTAKATLNVFVFFIALYYLILDREKITQEIVKLSPLKDAVDRQIMSRIVKTVRSVVFGALVIAVTQGVLATIGMTVFGVPGAFIWGALAIVAAEMPIIGVGLILIPAIAYLFLTGSVGNAIGLSVWSLIVVGLADNVLAPSLIKGKTHMHALAILISILGGIELFGPIGFIVGPTVLAALMVLVELYKSGILRE